MTDGRETCWLLSLEFFHATVVSLLLIVAFQNEVVGQRLPKADAITTEDGLSFRNVTAITQDSRGLMWFGTQQGICRYDGYRFIAFSNKPGADFYFPADRVLDNCLFFLPDSFLLVVADQQLFRLNIVNYRVDNLSEQLNINGNVINLEVTNNGKIWLSWENDSIQSLGYTDLKKIQVVSSVPRLRREFSGLAIDKNGDAWWSTISNGIQQYSPNGKLLHQVVVDSFVWFGTKMYFTPLHFDKNGQLFIFPKSARHVWTYNPSNKKVNQFSGELDDLAYNFLEDSYGSYWIGTKKGLYRYRDGKWSDYSATLHAALQFTEIHAISEDMANMLWLATDNGVLKIPIYKELFDNYLLVQNKQWGNAMRGLFEDKYGDLLFKCESGEAQGISKLDRKTGVLQQCTIKGAILKDTLLLDRAKQYVVDTTNNIAWTVADDLMKLDLTTMELEVVKSLSGYCNSFSHNPFCRLKNGKFLIGSTVDAIYELDASSRVFKKMESKQLATYKDVDTEAYVETAEGDIWIGTASAGLLKINAEGVLLAHYTINSVPQLSNNHVLSLNLAKDGSIWVGTFGGGINRLDELDGEIMIFSSKNGLANDNVTGILEDDIGDIWVSTYNGLSVIKRKDYSIVNYFEEDGLTNNEFNYSSQFKARDGTVWFGGMNGVNAIDPSVVINNNLNPALIFTAVEKHGKKIENYFLESQSNRIEVQPSYNYFQLSWTLPNYFKPDKNNYYVWMEGLDEGWSYVGNSNSIRYNKLPPGNYTFRVKGADSKGIWGQLSCQFQLLYSHIFIKHGGLRPW